MAHNSCIRNGGISAPLAPVHERLPAFCDSGLSYMLVIFAEEAHELLRDDPLTKLSALANGGFAKSVNVDIEMDGMCVVES